MQLELSLAEQPFEPEFRTATPQRDIPLQVSQFYEKLNRLFKSTDWTNNIAVVGEVASLTCRGSHLYFSLKDSSSKLSCKLFNYSPQRHGHRPTEGTRIIIRGRLESYNAYGDVYINVRKVELEGQGLLAARLEELRRRLQSEHLFDDDRKRPLPTFTRVIGVVTSSEGKAIGDIRKTCAQHAPHVRILLSPALVQGSNAPASLIRALHRLEAIPQVNVIILGRGGGSDDDLMTFNDEQLVRAVAACTKPIITAIGHDGNHSLCDLAADYEASTPTQAVYHAAPNRAELLNKVQSTIGKGQEYLRNILQRQRENVQNLVARSYSCSPEQRLSNAYQQLEDYRDRLLNWSANATQKRHYEVQSLRHSRGWQISLQRLEERQRQMRDTRALASSAMEDTYAAAREELASLRVQLSALNPRRALQRGYAMVSATDGQVITSVTKMIPGQTFSLSLSDGHITARVLEIKEIQC